MSPYLFIAYSTTSQQKTRLSIVLDQIIHECRETWKLVEREKQYTTLKWKELQLGEMGEEHAVHKHAI